jgi:Fic family protein
MTAVAFDSYRIVKRLRGAGFTEDQAEAVTTAIQDSTTLDLSNLAGKDQLAALEAKMATKDQLAALEAKMATKDQLAALEAKMATKDQLAALEAKMATKDQLAALEAKMATKDQLAALEAKMATQLVALNTKVDLTAARLEERIDRRGAESDARMVRWVVGTGIAAVLSLGGVLAGATTLILHALPATH